MELDDVLATPPMYQDIGSSMMMQPMVMGAMMNGGMGMYGGMGMGAGVYPSYGIRPARQVPQSDTFYMTPKEKDKVFKRKLLLWGAIGVGAIFLTKNIGKLFRKLVRRP